MAGTRDNAETTGQADTCVSDGWRNFCRDYKMPDRPTVLVVGLERTGLSICRFLAPQDVDIMVTDRKDSPELRTALNSLPRKPTVIDLGVHRRETMLSASCIFLSPGVPRSLDILQEALQAGIPIVNDIEVSSYIHRGQITAVTGSNGKSTVTALVGEVLARSESGSVVGGNIGSPILDQLAASGRYHSNLVLELSSFQLESIHHFRPHIGILLNLTPDHLDRYPSVDDYYQAKMRLFQNQGVGDTAILNYDDPEIRERAEKVPSTIIWFSRRRAVPEGIWLQDERVMVSRDGRSEKVGDLGSTRLQGMHNRENILAALATGIAAGVPAENALHVICEFPGISHRFEWIADIDGRSFINDSKATNIDSVRAGLSGYPRPIRLIAGGRDKGGDFASLRELVRTHVVKTYVIGEAADIISAAFDDVCDVTRSSSLRDAVHTAFSESVDGETILLSPGCASFDMFENFEDRGRQFVSLVQEMQEH